MTLQVVAGVIWQDDKLLIAKRPDDKPLGGFWEFPGGKIDAGETPLQALVRELREEIAIDVQSAEPILQFTHHDEAQTIAFSIWQIRHFNGVARGNEGQAIKWVGLEDLPSYRFPDANAPILDVLLTRVSLDNS